MSILKRSKTTSFREIMKEIEEDLERSGSVRVDELDWNPNTEILFYSIGKLSISKAFHNVKLPVAAKIMEEVKVSK